MTYPTIKKLMESRHASPIAPKVRAWLEAHAPKQWDAYQRHGAALLFRGAGGSRTSSMARHEGSLVTDTQRFRRSKDDATSFNLMADGANPGWPRRCFSTICTVERSYASDFGTVYVIIPPDNAKLATCIQSDFNMTTVAQKLVQAKMAFDNLCELGGAIDDGFAAIAGDANRAWFDWSADRSAWEKGFNAEMDKWRDSLEMLLGDEEWTQIIASHRDLMGSWLTSGEPFVAHFTKANELKFKGSQFELTTPARILANYDAETGLVDEVLANVMGECWFEGDYAMLPLTDHYDDDEEEEEDYIS